MSTILREPPAGEAAQLQYVIEQYLEETRRLNGEMEADQNESDRIRAETEAIRARTQETAVQTRAALARIKTMLAQLEAT